MRTTTKMNSFTIMLITLLLAVVSVPAAASCTPAGWVLFGPGASYNYIANGEPLEDACWNANPARVGFITDNACLFPNAYKFGYAGVIYQYIKVPPDANGTRWSLDYTLDFYDPNNDGANNRFTATVRDITTGITLASASYNGYNPDLFCSNRSMSFTGNFADRTLQVRFSGSTGYSNTKIAVRQIALWQY